MQDDHLREKLPEDLEEKPLVVDRPGPDLFESVEMVLGFDGHLKDPLLRQLPADDRLPSFERE